MSNIRILASTKIAFLIAANCAYGQSDFSTGGYAGIARFAAEESERLGYNSKEQAEKISKGYENAQEFLGQAFTKGQTIGRANPAQGAVNLGIGIAKKVLEETDRPEQPVRTTNTADLPEISEEITVPQREPETAFEEGPETQWCINSCLSTNGGNPASSAYQQCVANNCYPSQTASPPPKPQLSNAASYLANQHIGDGCEGRGGSIDPKGLTIRDLDGDGRDDLIIADEWIVCNGAKQQSNTCGIKVCSAVIYVRRGAILQRSTSINATGIEVANGRRPTVTFLQHDLSTFAFGWNGSAFAQR